MHHRERVVYGSFVVGEAETIINHQTLREIRNNTLVEGVLGVSVGFGVAAAALLERVRVLAPPSPSNYILVPNKTNRKLYLRGNRALYRWI